jgi:hypothetical protein
MLSWMNIAGVPARMNNQPSDSDALALARHAAASWIQEALKQNFTLARATALASERIWGGKTYSDSTLESWFYASGTSAVCWRLVAEVGDYLLSGRVQKETAANSKGDKCFNCPLVEGLRSEALRFGRQYG